MGSNGTSPMVIIITALITATSSILVAFIGVVPIFYEKKATVLPKPETCAISGTIISSGKKPLKNADVYLILATGSEYMTTTDDTGKFVFQGIANASYWVVVRNNESERASRVLIQNTETSGKIEVVESLLEYKRCKEQ